MKQLLIFLTFVASTTFASARDVVELRNGWKFHRGEVTDVTPDYEWQSVSVPHDWAIAGPFNLNEDMQYTKVIEDGETEARLRTGRTGALPATGIGIYRTTIVAPDASKRTSLEFDGVMSNAKIYINGIEVAYRPYGYASFSVDITDYLKPGSNDLEVRVENLPEMSRFYTGAGIYRPVRMVVTNPVHVAFDGTFVTTPNITKSHADIKQATEIVNATAKPLKAVVSTDIIAPDGSKVASTYRRYTLTAENNLIEQNLKLKNPLLWSPETPNCYRSVTHIIADNDTLDTYTTRFGIRTIEFDPNEGFHLNSKYTKLKGVCLHHDLGPIGAEVNYRATERQLQMMKQMGANAVRTSHNPPSRELIAICDSIGLMVIDEAFDEWRLGKCPNGYNIYFDQWAERDLTDFIRRDRNSPAVIMWSIGNEIREQDLADGAEVTRKLAQIVRREDPTRPSTAGFNNHWGAIANGLADEVDIVGFNYKHFDYVNRHNEHPEYILYGSETASAVSSRGIYKFPPRDNWEPWHPDYQLSSYDMEYVPWGSAPDTEFAQQDDNAFLLGEFVWTGFDYLGEPSPYGEGAPSRSSYFGIVDLAGIPKDRYYLYQSQWSDEPVLHIMPHWTWPGREGQSTPIQCYTNYPQAELFVNGVSHGIRKVDPAHKFLRYRLMWDNVVYQPGEICVVAYDNDGNERERKTIATASSQCNIVTSTDRETLKANGHDLAFITIDITDNQGRLCPDASPMLFVNVKGAGRLKALCNGDATDLTSFTSNYMRAFSGKLVAVVETTDAPGEITVTISGERLNHTKVHLKSL